MKQDYLSGRQFLALASLGPFCALVRRYPLALVRMAGRSAWLAGPIALPVLLLWLLILASLLRLGRGGLGDAFTEALGPFLTKLLLGLYGLWALCYAGFTLRAGAERLVSTLYPEAGHTVFVLAMALACAPAAAGPLRALGRSAMVLRPILLSVIGLMLLLSLGDADPTILLPVRVGELPKIAGAGLSLAGTVMSAGLFTFLIPAGEERPRLRGAVGWTVILALLTGLVAAVCLSMFGPALAAEMRYPFFMLARDISILGALERVEPLVAAMWIFTDFILVSALLWLGPRLLLRALGREKKTAAPPFAWLGTALAALTALLLPSDPLRWEWLSQTLVPLLSAGMTAGIPVLAALVGGLRGRFRRLKNLSC